LGTAGQVLAVNSGATALTWVTPLSSIVAGSNQVTVSTTNGVATVDVDTANMVISTMAGTLGVGQGGTGLTSVGANGQVMTASNGALVWSTPGTVTSVGITAGSDQITVTGGPITTSGNITVDVNTANLNISEMTGVLPVNMGGTGITTYGAPNQVLATNSIGTGLVWVDQGSGTPGTGTVTSVAVVASSNRLTVSGSPITSSGTINIDVVQANLDLSQIGGQVGVTQGGTGLTTMGTAGQVLTVNSAGTGLQWSTVSGSGTVTSVAVTAGSNKLTVSGSPITTNGTITVDVNQANLNITAMSGTLATTQGGTGLTTLGNAGQVLTVNSGGTGLVYSSIAASQVTGLATVATTGSYTDLINTPTIPAAYTLPTATASTLGGVMVGSGLAISSGVLSATNTNTGTVTSVSLTAGSNKVTVSGSPITSSGTLTVDVNPANINLTTLAGTLATTQGGTGLTTLGTAGQVLVVNAGATGLTWAAPSTYTLPAATTSTLGGVIVGSGLSVASGVLSATNTNTGTVTSVALAAGSDMVTVSGSPITSTGTLTVNVNPANISLTALGGTLGTTQGGTGLTTLGTAGQALVVNAGATGLQYTTVGTVTSVNVAGDSSNIISFTGGPVTTSGTITAAINQANISLPNLGGTLNTTQGGTGLTALGTAGQVLTVNSAGTGLQWSTPSAGGGSGTVTSVAVASTTNAITVSGSPITDSGTIDVTFNPANVALTALGGTLGTTQGGTGLTTLGTAGQVLAVNSGGTGLTWTTPASGGSGGSNPAGSTAPGYYTFYVTIGGTGNTAQSVSGLPSGWSANIATGTGLVQITHNVGRQPYNVIFYGATSATAGGTTVWAVTGAYYASTFGTFTIPDSGNYTPSTTAFNLTLTKSSTQATAATNSLMIQVMF
jgi:hypothetical protein